jgi:hypothetical protein
MHNSKALFRRAYKGLGIIIFCAVFMFPMHDEMNPASLEKDIIIHSHVLEHKEKKLNVSLNNVISFLQDIYYYKPEPLKTPAIFLSFTLINSFSTTILRL